MTSPAPVLFVFGIHFHQPVGNFDSVFEQHLADVYRPLFEHLESAGCFPLTLHVSGPLLSWLEEHAGDMVDTIGRLAADGRVEMLASGYDEPILAALSREDRADQVYRMRERLHRRFGVAATGLWLTERVWEPDLAADLADAGIEYIFLDDRHFLVSGFEKDRLHVPYRTEFAGRQLGVLPIDERLRYLIPFKPPEAFAEYVTGLRAQGFPLAVLADDGEKFGGWPGTKVWVYEKGWLRGFLDTLTGLRDADAIQLITGAEATRVVPSGGLAYLPSASYREMEEWSLPPRASGALKAIEEQLGDLLDGPERALVRGAHWRNFLVKYPESNRMHKKAALLSRMARDRSEPPAGVREAIGRAHCNDAYWHGIFGGLYLPHLRAAVWRNLAEAEGELRKGEPLAFELIDWDGDGHDEVWVHSESFSAIISPARGGAVEEWTVFALGRNALDVLTRHPEAYHRIGEEENSEPPPSPTQSGDGLPSIHGGGDDRIMMTEAQPPIDREPRTVLLDRVLDAATGRDEFISGDYLPLRSWVGTPMTCVVRLEANRVVVELTGEGDLVKRLTFSEVGRIDVEYEWVPPPDAEGAVFTTELTTSTTLIVEGGPSAADDRWDYPVETLARSEQGFERTVQGLATLLRWPASSGKAAVGFTQR